MQEKDRQVHSFRLFFFCIRRRVHSGRTVMIDILIRFEFNGKTSISLNKLFDIADVLEVPVKDLFDFRDT